MSTLFSSPRSKNHHFWPEANYLSGRRWNAHRIWRRFQDECDHNVASHPFSLMTGPCTWRDLAWPGRTAMTLLSRVRAQQRAGAFVVRCLPTLLLSSLLRCVTPSMIDVRPQDSTHLSPAACLTAVRRASAQGSHVWACSSQRHGTSSSGVDVVFGRVQRPTYQMPPFVHESSLPAELTPLPVCCSSIGWEEIGGVTDQSRCCFASFPPFASLCWSQSMLLFNMCPTLLLQFPGAKE